MAKVNGFFFLPQSHRQTDRTKTRCPRIPIRGIKIGILTITSLYLTMMLDLDNISYIFYSRPKSLRVLSSRSMLQRTHGGNFCCSSHNFLSTNDFDLHEAPKKLCLFPVTRPTLFETPDPKLFIDSRREEKRKKYF